jgi:hypothetical protein
MAEFVQIAGRSRDDGRETSRARTESGHRQDRGASFGFDPGGSSLDECQRPVRRVGWAERAALLGTHELAWLRGGGAEMVISTDWCA